MVLALERGEGQAQREKALGAVSSLSAQMGTWGQQQLEPPQMGREPPAQILGHSSSSPFLRAW